MQLAILGIDLAKSVFQLHGVDARGNALLRKRVSRQKLTETVAMLPQCQIVMEACGSAHFWAREFERLGHSVRLIGAQYVKPFVKSQKNDRNDAEAICEAAQRPNMRFVPVKSSEQQDIQAAHRLRGLLVKHQTALVNQIRGLLAEYGIVVRQGRSSIYKALPDILEDAANGLSGFVRRIFAELYAQLKAVMQQIRQADTRLVELFSHSAACQRIAEIPGVGPLTNRCRSGRCQELSQRPAPCRLARAHSRTTLLRWQGATLGHHQTRGQIPAQLTDSRRTYGMPICDRQNRSRKPMASGSH
jgi:transposase